MSGLDYKRIRATYGKTWLKTGEIGLDPSVLELIGQTLINTIRQESLNEFAKRGWSVNDPMGGKSIGDSFNWRVLGDKTVVVESTFYGLDQLISRDGIPERKMTWLTQQGSGRDLIKKKRKKRISNKSLSSPLVVPITTKTGEVIFRVAPLRMADAWIHPGIARFNFMERGIKKAKAKVNLIIQEYCGNIISAGIAESFNKR